MNTNEFLKHYEEVLDTYYLLGKLNELMAIRPRAVMADGFSISIQASEIHYCEPRVNHAVYTKVELGYPSADEELIADWAEDEDLTGTVYGYVPVEIVDKVIEKHGGIDLDATEKEHEELEKKRKASWKESVKVLKENWNK